MSDQQTTPAHPLVIDRKTGLARLATQDDVDVLEVIRAQHEAIMRDFAEKLRMGKLYQEQLETTYGR